ncbi:hypothetical protein AK812_SmicGene19795 [Symbiodinium microadriaticum]|uniref:Heterokaryon incompatibility domain-containing protein n=1 Tax=Symbiodinium microadriaticum TaxID=2951 RepID=A0A1Q9DRP5_SYMMI|nr:hypothetical protein AK812_SmicGene19795 [Symbiodinium microadriaticum]
MVAVRRGAGFVVAKVTAVAEDGSFYVQTGDGRPEVKVNQKQQVDWVSQGPADWMQSASPGFRLSRQVAKGEVIDFFVSHSWSDGPERKWRALQLVAEMFYAQHGRYPTFWVDKFCIDQRDVADGLRVLPVNVMACRLSFMSLEMALKQLVVRFESKIRAVGQLILDRELNGQGLMMETAGGNFGERFRYQLSMSSYASAVHANTSYSLSPGVAKGPLKVVIGPVTLPQDPGEALLKGQVAIKNSKGEPVACIALDIDVPLAAVSSPQETRLTDEPGFCNKPTDHFKNASLTQSGEVTQLSGTLDEDLNAVVAHVDLTVQALFVKLPLKLAIPMTFTPAIPKGDWKTPLQPHPGLASSAEPHPTTWCALLCRALQMATSGATLSHLQALQAMRPLEPPVPLLGSAALPVPSPKELLLSAGAADGGVALQYKTAEELQDVVRTADFWISLLEGEQNDLQEEISKHKKKQQLTIRQSEAKASALREAEVERKRLLSELKWLQESRDKAICERHMLREDTSRLTTRRQEDVQSLAARTEAIELELQREREEKAELERQLVRTKVRFAETLQSKDTLEAILDYYEGQLKLLSPGFEPQDRDSLGIWLRPARNSCDSSEVESLASGTTSDHATVDEKHSKGGRYFMKNLGSKVKSMLKGSGGGSSRRAQQSSSDSHDQESKPPTVDPTSPPSLSGDEPSKEAPAAAATAAPTEESPKPRGQRRWELRQE